MHKTKKAFMKNMMLLITIAFMHVKNIVSAERVQDGDPKFKMNLYMGKLEWKDAGLQPLEYWEKFLLQMATEPLDHAVSKMQVVCLLTSQFACLKIAKHLSHYGTLNTLRFVTENENVADARKPVEVFRYVDKNNHYCPVEPAIPLEMLARLSRDIITRYTIDSAGMHNFLDIAFGRRAGEIIREQDSSHKEQPLKIKLF